VHVDESCVGNRLPTQTRLPWNRIDLYAQEQELKGALLASAEVVEQSADDGFTYSSRSFLRVLLRQRLVYSNTFVRPHTHL
jgi:hypothetical protein